MKAEDGEVSKPLKTFVFFVSSWSLHGHASDRPRHKVVIARSDDLHLDKVARPIDRWVALCKIDRSVDLGRLGGQPCSEDQLVVRGWSVDEDARPRADPLTLTAANKTLLQRHDPISPALLRLSRHVVFELKRRGAFFV